MGEKGIDCRLEVLYPIKKAGIDVWDFVRCLGILLDNAAEGALETETPLGGDLTACPGGGAVPAGIQPLCQNH